MKTSNKNLALLFAGDYLKTAKHNLKTQKESLADARNYAFKNGLNYVGGVFEQCGEYLGKAIHYIEMCEKENAKELEANTVKNEMLSKYSACEGAF